MSSAQMIMTGVVLDYPNALVDSVMTKRATADTASRCTLCANDVRSSDTCAQSKDGQHVTGGAKVAPLGKCINPATGEPISARRDAEAVLPVPGTVQNRAQATTVPGKVNLDLPMTSEDGNGTGTCPECSAHVKLSGKGFITAHNVRKESIPAPPPTVRLAERQTTVTETGVRVGSPDASERSRSAELSGVRYAGWHAPLALPENGETVAIVMRRPKVDENGQPVLGKTRKPLTVSETVRVPATEANVRTALRQEQRKKLRKDKKSGEMVGGPDKALLARLGRILKGLTGAEAVPVIGAQPGTYKVREAAVMDAPNAPEGREERRREDGRVGHVASSPGPALVPGRGMSGDIPGEKDRTNRKGKPKNAIGWDQPIGRPRLDRVAVEGNPEACGGRDCKLDQCPAILGGRHGYMECRTFRGLPKTAKRRYWAHVATNKRRYEEARELSRRPKMPAGHGYVTGNAPTRAAVQRVG